MALNRLKSVAQHITGTTPPHPFDPLSNAEIEAAVHIVRRERGQLAYNAVTLLEPRKKEMLVWIEDPINSPRPIRVADVVAIAPGGKVVEGWVDLYNKKLLKWETLEGVQPLVSIRWGHACTTMLIGKDNHGRSSNRRTCLPQGSKSHPTVRVERDPGNRYA